MEDEKKTADAADKDKLPNIRTFKTDAEIYMRDKGLSTLDIATKSYMAGEKKSLASSIVNSHILKYAMITLAAAAVIGGLGYVSVEYIILPRLAIKNSIEKPPQAFKNFVAVDGEKEISVLPYSANFNSGELLRAIQSELGKSLRYNTVIYFPIKTESSGTAKYTDSVEFIKLMSWVPPPLLTASLYPEFNAYIVYGERSSDFAAAFKVNDFSRAFEAMLGWEKTMWSDWKPFLGNQDYAYLQDRPFEDFVIKNNDARVLRNKDGGIVMGYSIFSKQFVVVSNSENALGRILELLILIPPRQ
ncbi:hypothetical protein HYT01_01035 [Candidatus Giovannonibacteria bacterium]|nr:hypothetical protein [Candidatus Giovannonibacteria bacterium]